MSQVCNWWWDDTNKKWVKAAGTSTGALSIHAIVEELNDIEDVDVATPTDQHIIYRDDAAGKWKAKAIWTAAHKDTHDPIDGSDKLDTAAPVKIGEANAIGSSHSYPRADHVHEKHHAKYTDAEAKAAAVQAGAITNGVTKAPTHDAVFDVKTTAETATTPGEVDAKITTHSNLKTGIHGVGARKVAETSVEDLDLASHKTRHEYGGADELGGLFVGLAGAATTIYRVLNASATPRTATVDSIAGDVITLTTAVAPSFWHDDMDGNVYLKICNTTRAEYAWVKDMPANNQLQVTVAADIADWVNGNAISTAEDGAASEYVELDISPSVPATARFIHAIIHAQDNGTITATTDTGITEDTSIAPWARLNQYCQVSDLPNRNAGIIPIANSTVYVRDRASGVNTGNFGVYVTAYIT